MMIIIIIPIIILIILNLIIIILLGKLTKSSKKDSNFVNISIIIAARNEQPNIHSLIASIRNLDYPSEMFEVIVVDDNSTDNTFNEFNTYAGKFNNIKIVRLNKIDKTGKREALTFGVDNAKYPHIVITDADCNPETGWLKAYSGKFNSGSDLIFGIAPYYQTYSIINKISCFENLRSSLLSISFASAGLPYSAAARNFGYTKKAFEFIVGYTNTTDTISGDDDLLLREAVKKKLKIAAVVERGSFVYSRSKESFKDYFNQRARHTQTSAHYLLKHKLLLGTWHLLNLCFTASIFFMVFYPMAGILLAAKLIVDSAVVKLNEKHFGYRFNYFEIILLQLVYEVLLVVHFFNSRFMKVKWK